MHTNKKATNHVHKFKRKTYKTSGTHMFFCCLPDCYFKSEPDFLVGKESICHRCGKVFILNMYSITLVKPHCDDCTIKRGNYYEQRGSVKAEVSIPMSAIVSQSIAADVTADLEQRLRIAALPELNNLTKVSEAAVIRETAVIKEYNPNDDEDEL